jgi:NADH dehydrogenase
VQLTIGDLADPLTFPSALRGVDTVVHMAAAIRDQKGGTIEELNSTATWRLLQAAQTAGVKRFIYFSALNATPDTPTRFLKAKAAAERAVADSPLDTTIFAPSIVYANGDVFQTILKRMAILPVVPISGNGKAQYEPIWADDVADCVLASLTKPAVNTRYEMAGPETLTYDEIARELLAAVKKKRPFIHVPIGLVKPSLQVTGALLRSRAPTVWDEVELMEVPMLSRRGTADAESLGVDPLPMAEALSK